MIGMYDLKEAFYSVVVQLLHQMPGEEDELQAVLEGIDIPAWLRPQLEYFLGRPGLLDSVTDNSHLAALVAEGHRNRWTTHRHTEAVMEPHKGTRPGVPLADANFNLLFSRVHRYLRELMKERG